MKNNEKNHNCSTVLITVGASILALFYVLSSLFEGIRIQKIRAEAIPIFGSVASSIGSDGVDDAYEDIVELACERIGSDVKFKRSSEEKVKLVGRAVRELSKSYEKLGKDTNEIQNYLNTADELKIGYLKNLTNTKCAIYDARKDVKTAIGLPFEHASLNEVSMVLKKKKAS